MHILFVNEQLSKIIFFKYTVDIDVTKYTIRNAQNLLIGHGNQTNKDIHRGGIRNRIRKDPLTYS